MATNITEHIHKPKTGLLRITVRRCQQPGDVARALFASTFEANNLTDRNAYHKIMAKSLVSKI